MKFRKFAQNKLWRDKLVEKGQNEGSKLYFLKLDDKEFIEQLKIKLLEEANEVHTASTKKELLEELADVLEVINSFCNVNKFSLQDIIDVQTKKYQERGGFDGRNFITYAEHPEGSFGEKYCLNDPEKYPEIKD